MSDSNPLSNRVAEEIRVILVRRRMSGRQLAATMGVSQTWLADRLNGKTPIDLNELERIASTLGVEVVDLFSRAADGGTVVFAGSSRRQTTVSNPTQPERPSPVDRPKRTTPPASTRRPARTRAVHAQTRPQRRMPRNLGARDGEA